MPDYRETLIHIDHRKGVAYIWTASPEFARRCKDVGAKPSKRQIGGAWYELPEGQIRLTRANETPMKGIFKGGN